MILNFLVCNRLRGQDGKLRVNFENFAACKSFREAHDNRTPVPHCKKLNFLKIDKFSTFNICTVKGTPGIHTTSYFYTFGAFLKQETTQTPGITYSTKILFLNFHIN